MEILNTPSIYSISAFDPTNDYTFQFYYTGNQIYSNRAVITNNETQEIVYDEIQDSLKTSHTLPANTLDVGNSYTIQIQVFDNDGNSSNLSMATLFYCFTLPSFYFGNLSNGDTISSANYELELIYGQSETETLNEYQYYVYDGMKEEIYSSKLYYTSENLTHTIYGLQNESTYFVRAIGNTVHGMYVDTGFIEIHVFHMTIKPNITFVATNDKKTGCITLQSNIFTISYDIENEDYSFEDGLVNLENNVLTYKVGTSGDFSLVLNTKKIPIGTFFNCNDGLISVSIVCISNTYYCNLKIKTMSESYDIFKELTNVIIENNYITLDSSIYSDETLFSFEIHRNNNIYDLQVTYV